ncbi:GNAT family N-acetyltransferase [Rhizobium sp. FKY42]|uniref:GNAT family N-acetyltransferase n=1 Tax=Rhizobium sp. FKY42 TaxID=2562310 RepID=UPI001FF06BF9|nr:GNAT family N-acetyltransferase [Rhizobium sp. FKY42]
MNGYSVELRTPELADYMRLRKISGLTPFSEEASRIGLKGTIFGVSVCHGKDVIGMGRIIGDGGCFFQITDIAVDPAHQGQGLGKKIMGALTDYIRENLPETAYVSLIADVPANRLYEQYGFSETAPRSLGMSMIVGR